MEKITLGKFDTAPSYSTEGKEFPPMPRAMARELGKLLGRVAGGDQVEDRQREEMMKVVETVRKLSNAVINGQSVRTDQMVASADMLGIMFRTFQNELATLPPFGGNVPVQDIDIGDVPSSRRGIT